MSQDSQQLTNQLSNVSIERQCNGLNIVTEMLKKAMVGSQIIKTEIKLLVDTMGTSNIVGIFSEVLNIYKSCYNWQNLETYPQLLNAIEDEVFAHSSVKDKLEFTKVYRLSLEKSFDDFFKSSHQLLNTMINKEITQINLPSIQAIYLVPVFLGIKSYEPVLYTLVKFLECCFKNFNNIGKYHYIFIEMVLRSNHYLVNYLAVPHGMANTRGLVETIFIYSQLRTNLINGYYENSELISNVLIILEQRSRFFGLTADAIPENVNHGDYIEVDSLNAPLEDDEVYEDYEKFLESLPNSGN